MDRLGKAEKFHERMKVAEQICAIKNPIYEAEYEINKEDRYTLNLYQSYLPRLKEYMRSKNALIN